MAERTQLLLIGGRSGVGKTAVSHEVHARLITADCRHCVIDGDNLDLAHPAPWEHHLAERNLAAMWRNYHDVGYRRLVYVNTMSVQCIDVLVETIGDAPATTAVLLTAQDDTIRSRLQAREIGGGLAVHLERSAMAARRLEATPPAAVRISTDGRSVMAIAAEIVDLTGWLAA